MEAKSNDYFIDYSDQLPSYEHFYENVMRKNIACMFGPQLTEQWTCRKEWTIDGQSIDFDHLVNKYATLPVPVYDCSEKHFNSNPRTEMLFSQYADYWQQQQQQQVIDANRILYLKDWHLAQDSNCGDFYKIPTYFESDYLNEYCTAKSIADFKFTYMGPKGSTTPLHVDVFGSFSWSANVIGTKRWLMIPDHCVETLKQLIGVNNLPHDLYTLPNYEQIIAKVNGFEIIQKAGQVLFVPSGYMHQVENIEHTISINHNWFNACNLDRVYSNLLNALKDVQNEMSDLKNTDEWNETCDRILTIHFGMNRSYFMDQIRHITTNRLLRQSNHFRYKHDIECLAKIYTKILSNHQFQNKNHEDWKNCESLKSLNKLL
ncbi:JmjC domain-containing protein 4 [Dermatophagoides farinae]|uniref:Jumonji domain-containing protein 4 n=1 Tax=Dermatophagoides farinae TaxID=6954 RepID=A0A922IAS5_DERFA|nr:JmjC domain-containing protein 4 [Dermatophagoides farinae]